MKTNNNLQKNHKALASQFRKKGFDLDNIENKLEYSVSIIKNINLILISFLATPSKDEKDCIHQMIKYLTNNHIKE